jgi:hypothetical protein
MHNFWNFKIILSLKPKSAKRIGYTFRKKEFTRDAVPSMGWQQEKTAWASAPILERLT